MSRALPKTWTAHTDAARNSGVATEVIFPQLALIFVAIIKGSAYTNPPLSSRAFCFPVWAIVSYSLLKMLRPLATNKGVSRVHIERSKQPLYLSLHVLYVNSILSVGWLIA